jgi:mono/diheme cytochrome c family protein
MIMRYLLAGFLLIAVGVVGVAGFRGGLSRRPPIEVFPDMDRQAKLRPQSGNEFFADRFSSRFHAPNTIPRAAAVQVAGQPVWPFEDHPLNTGMVAGTPVGATNFVEVSPLPITAELVSRGRERFSIHCQPCHGAAGDGKGATTKYGMVVIANLHDPRIVRMADGEIFNTVTLGKNLMQGYASNLAPEDRWAVLAYVRALQLSRLATLEEVPADQQAALK